MPLVSTYIKTLPLLLRVILKYHSKTKLALPQLVNLTKKTINKATLQNCLTKTEQAFINEYLHAVKTDEYIYDPGVSRLIAQQRLEFHLKGVKKEPLASKKEGHPEIIVLGYPKCATTWLYEAIKQLPWLDVPQKEIEYFGSWRFAKGERWYRSHFKSSKPSVDVSVGSISNPEIWKRIKVYEQKHQKSLKKIVFVRKPSKRTLSFLRHRKAKGEGYYNFNKYLASGYVNNMFIKTSDYLSRLDQLSTFFSSSQLFIVFQEDIVKDPRSTLIKIVTFMLGSSINSTAIKTAVRKIKFREKHNDSKQIRFFPLLKFGFNQEAWWKSWQLQPLDYVGYALRKLTERICYTNISQQRHAYKLFVENHQLLQRLDREYEQLKAWLDKRQINHT